MISVAELKRKAARTSAPLEVLERDYVLGWFLLGLSQVPNLREAVAFKGGTALRKVYFPEYRFSEDLDFTLSLPMEESALEAAIETTCGDITRTSGVRMTLADWRQVRDAIGQEAYRARVEYIGPLGGPVSAPPRITLDFTRYEKLILPPRLLPILHPYSDVPPDPRRVPTYRLEEMLAEKLRALLSRGFPRDLYDVWYLLAHSREDLDRSVSLQVLHEKCRYKGYPFSSAADFLRLGERQVVSAAWVTSLQRLVTPLPPYETVIGELQTLLADWLGTDAPE